MRILTAICSFARYTLPMLFLFHVWSWLFSIVFSCCCCSPDASAERKNIQNACPKLSAVFGVGVAYKHPMIINDNVADANGMAPGKVSNRHSVHTWSVPYKQDILWMDGWIMYYLKKMLHSSISI